VMQAAAAVAIVAASNWTSLMMHSRHIWQIPLWQARSLWASHFLWHSRIMPVWNSVAGFLSSIRLTNVKTRSKQT